MRCSGSKVAGTHRRKAAGGRVGLEKLLDVAGGAVDDLMGAEKGGREGGEGVQWAATAKVMQMRLLLSPPTD